MAEPRCAFVCVRTKSGEEYLCEAEEGSGMHEPHGASPEEPGDRFCFTMACHPFVQPPAAQAEGGVQ